MVYIPPDTALTPMENLAEVYESFCREQKLDCAADAQELLLDETLTAPQRAWLTNFTFIWDYFADGLPVRIEDRI